MSLYAGSLRWEMALPLMEPEWVRFGLPLMSQCYVNHMVRKHLG